MEERVLTEAQLKAAYLLSNGESQVKTAKKVNVNVKTIQRWLKEDWFKVEVDRNVQLLKSKVDEKISMNIEPIMNRLIDIALKSDSEKTSLDACVYAINRLVGTPTNKTQDITEDKDKKEDFINLDNLIDETIDTKNDNIVELPKKKAK
ncbi:carbon monoxide dehydrogenase [Hathewaya histolytica]|uniref:DNA-binding protein n=1 Tax=Hathewaya histolytica TaxID=1498 RepID=A0A4U9R6B5_HATHI|nr:carbon monoxide dehydrogenase [Hathewaya histolytica]VTQ86925.1 DNA-binding protein [Hathewaya histolytica]